MASEKLQALANELGAVHELVVGLVLAVENVTSGCKVSRSIHCSLHRYLDDLAGVIKQVGELAEEGV